AAAPLVLAGDVDKDGHQDLVEIDRSALQATVFFGDGAGGFRGASPATGPLGTLGSSIVTAARLADLDGDGALDLVVATDTGLAVHPFASGSGAFDIALSVDEALLYLDVAVVDLDGD